MPGGPGVLPRRPFGTFSAEGKGTAGYGAAQAPPAVIAAADNLIIY